QYPQSDRNPSALSCHEQVLPVTAEHSAALTWTSQQSGQNRLVRPASAGAITRPETCRPTDHRLIVSDRVRQGERGASSSLRLVKAPCVLAGIKRVSDPPGT